MANHPTTRSTDAAAARGLCGEQILEVADRTDRAGIAVEYEVRQPEREPLYSATSACTGYCGSKNRDHVVMVTVSGGKVKSCGR